MKVINANHKPSTALVSKWKGAFPNLKQLPDDPDFAPFNGMNGRNRAPQKECQIHAYNDYQAIQCWLREYEQTPTTARLYRKEAERLLLWCLFECQKALSSLRRDDLRAYFTFIQDPQPAERWCAPAGGRGHKRGNANWRPFVGPLSVSSQKNTQTIIHSLFSYLYEVNYLAHHPFKGWRAQKTQRTSFDEHYLETQQRILSAEEWEAMLKTLNDLPVETPHECNDKERLRFLVLILYFLGLRIGELESHTWSAFKNIHQRWWFVVKGKGGKIGKIPVNSELLEAVKRFRTHLAYDALPDAQEVTPIMPSWRGPNSLTARQMNKLLKALAVQTAKQHFSDRPDVQRKLSKFSAHWLRHLSASMQDQAGIAFKYIRANHRHENDATTRLYVHALDEERHEAMERLVLGSDSVNM